MTLDRTHVVKPDVSNAGSPNHIITLVTAINALLDVAFDRTGIISQSSTVTLGTVSGLTQVATIQLKDNNGVNIASVQKIEAYMSTDAAGLTPSSAGAGTSATVTTGSLLKAVTAKLYFVIVTDATGKAAITFDNTTGGGTYTDRVTLVVPGNGNVTSAALAIPNA